MFITQHLMDLHQFQICSFADWKLKGQDCLYLLWLSHCNLDLHQRMWRPVSVGWTLFLSKPLRRDNQPDIQDYVTIHEKLVSDFNFDKINKCIKLFLIFVIYFISMKKKKRNINSICYKCMEKHRLLFLYDFDKGKSKLRKWI